MVASTFDLEQTRLAAARGLPAECFDDFARLSRTLIHGPPFQWLLVDAPDERLREQVIKALDEVLRKAGLTSNKLPLSARIGDVAELEQRLVKNANAAAVVHVIGRPGWFDAARWEGFNARRERLAAQARARLIFWLDREAIALASSGAPDLWAWRGGVYSFHGKAVARLVEPRPAELRLEGGAPVVSIDSRWMAARSRRVAELRSWLTQQPALPDELMVAPADELGRLLYDLGEYDGAMEHWQTLELPLHGRLGDERAQAMTKGQIADILQARGQLDEALRIRTQEELPVYERLGDVRARAVTMGKIADILQDRGHLDEALRIRTQEQLPVCELLGDVRAKAITMSKIADILHARGQLDEALSIYKKDVQPIFERVGDVRSKAVTMGKIADILQDRGQLDEAMRIRAEEELPVYERLGDVREKAVATGKIADILQDRGQLDEALRIRTEEQLPVYERLGEVRSKAVTMGKIADILQARGQLDEALRIRIEEELPVYERLGDVRSKAATMGQIAEIHRACGQLDEALRIYKENVQPTFERLGEVRSIAVTKAKIGLLLIDVKGSRVEEARALLQAAHADLARMKLPEAEWLAAQIRRLGLEPPSENGDPQAPVSEQKNSPDQPPGTFPSTPLT